MALQDVITNLGTAIINLVTSKITKHASEIEETLLDLKAKVDALVENGGDTSGGGTVSSVNMLDFVNNTEVNTLTTTSKTIVGSINEVDGTIGEIDTELTNIIDGGAE